MYSSKPLISYGGFPFKCLLITFFIRFVDYIWIRSSYVPDEYWQSLEIAHKESFGFGFTTWEWKNGVRNYIYPSIFTVLYKILKYFQFDTIELVVSSPRILQALISALGDVYFLRWINERRSGKYSWAFLCWITCSFISYCSTRTLTNTIEMNLTCIALYYYPWTPKNNTFPFVFLLTLTCFIRPTASLTWLPLVLINIFTNKNRILYAIRQYLPVVVVTSAICVGFDSYMYGNLTITPWNFFKFNILQNIGSFYGTHDLLWYLYCGIPVVMGVHTIPLVLSAFKNIQRLKHIKYDLEVQLLVIIVWNLVVFSICPHKEFRFLLPLMPMMIYLSSSLLSRWSVDAKYTQLYGLGTIIVVVHLITIIFLGQFHQMGTLETASKLGHMAMNNTKADILYLAPCHTFPGYTHLHTNVSSRHLTCDPNLFKIDNYVDEADLFYRDPTSWLKREFATSRPCTLPTHVIKFDSLNITNYLHSNNFTIVSSIFHTYYPLDERIGKNVQIFQRKGPKCANI